MHARDLARLPCPPSTEELVATVLGGSRPRPEHVAQAAHLLAHGGLRRLLDCVAPSSDPEARVAAALQLGLRVRRAVNAGAPLIDGPDAAWAVVGPALACLPTEELHALYVDTGRRLLAHVPLSRGSSTATMVDPREIFHHALQRRAAAVVLAHNHPSGDPEPSAQDRRVTDRVVSAARVVGIPLLDHLVVVDHAYTSMAARGWVPAPGARAEWMC